MLSIKYVSSHVKPDVLLVYWVDIENKKLVVERLGSHSELF